MSSSSRFYKQSCKHHAWQTFTTSQTPEDVRDLNDHWPEGPRRQNWGEMPAPRLTADMLSAKHLDPDFASQTSRREKVEQAQRFKEKWQRLSQKQTGRQPAAVRGSVHPQQHKHRQTAPGSSP